MSIDPDSVFFIFIGFVALTFAVMAWRLTRRPGGAAEQTKEDRP